jgi:hypothetical protein
VAVSTRAKNVALRLFIADLLAFPISLAWAFGSVPAVVILVASAVGTSLDDEAIAHRVLLRVAWPWVGSFVLAHVPGLIWGLDRDDRRGRRTFVASMVALGAVPVVLGGASWIWLMTR